MSANLPEHLISIPADCDPRSRSVSGGRGGCQHHYVENCNAQSYREWVCLNCDRLCYFQKWDTHGRSL